MGDWSGQVLIGLVVAAVGGFLLARFLFRLGEMARQEALEAQCREEVKAAGVARDRNRTEALELGSKLSDLREEHSHCEERLRGMELELNEIRTSDLSAANEKDGLLQQAKTLQNQVKERDAIIGELESHVGSHAGMVTKLQERCEASQAELSETQQQLGAANDNLQQFEQDLADAVEAHSDCDHRIRSLEAEVAQISDQRSTLEQQLDTLEQTAGDAAAAQKKLVELTEQNAELQRRSDSVPHLQRELTELQATYTACADRMHALEQQEGEHEKLRKQFEQRGQELKQRAKQIAALESERDRLEHVLGENEKQLSDLEEHVVEFDQLQAELERATQTTELANGEAEQLRGRVDELARLEPLVEQRDGEIFTLKAELEQARDVHSGCDDRIGSLEKKLDRSEKLQKDHEVKLTKRDGRIADLEATVEERDEALAVGEPSWLLDAPEGEADDLQEIGGIGGIFAARLNELGIFHYRQLARLNPAETAWISLRLNTSPARVTREKWILQAKKLMKKKK